MGPLIPPRSRYNDATASTNTGENGYDPRRADVNFPLRGLRLSDSELQASEHDSTRRVIFQIALVCLLAFSKAVLDHRLNSSEPFLRLRNPGGNLLDVINRFTPVFDRNIAPQNCRLGQESCVVVVTEESHVKESLQYGLDRTSVPFNCFQRAAALASATSHVVSACKS